MLELTNGLCKRYFNLGVVPWSKYFQNYCGRTSLGYEPANTEMSRETDRAESPNVLRQTDQHSTAPDVLPPNITVSARSESKAMYAYVRPGGTSAGSATDHPVPSNNRV